MKKISIFLALLLLVGSLALTFSPNRNVRAQADPSIRIEPIQLPKLSVGESFTVNVTVENCINITGVQADLRFNPEVLNITSIVEGPFLRSFGDTIVVPNTWLQEGQILYAAALVEVLGASGSGVLFNVTFQVLSEGSSILKFEPYYHGSEVGTYFMDTSMNEIWPDLIDGFYGTPFLFSSDLSKVNVGGDVSFSCQVLGISEVLNITFRYRKMGGEWMDLETKPSNASGFVSFVWTPKEAGDFEFKVYTLLENVSVESEIVSVSVEAVFDFMPYVYIGVVISIILVGVIFIYKRRKRAVSEKSEVPT